MSRARFAAIPLFFVVAACGGPKSEPPPVEPTPADIVDEVPSKVPLRGVVSRSNGAMVFSECGAPAGSSLTLTDSQGELAGAFASLEAKPAGGIYVELERAAPADGKSGAWTRLLRARGLNEIIACDAAIFDGDFVASGNEPFWAIEIRGSGIVYLSPEFPRGRVYPYAITPTASEDVVYATKIAEPEVSTLEITLEPGRCVDSMSGELRSFKAHVVLDDRKLEGCARAGVPRGELGDAPLDELLRFAGSYPHTVHLWDDPAIHNRLEALLGPDMEAFLDNMKVQSPLTKDGGVYYVVGNMPHRGGLDNAAFLADPASDTINVILFVDKARKDFKEGGREVALPADVVTMIENIDAR